MGRKRYRQLLGLLVVIGLPSVVIAWLGWQVIAQQSMLDHDQAEARRKATAVEIGTELRERVNRILAQELAATDSASADAYTDPSVVLDAWADSGKLVLPWESDEPNPEPFRRADRDLNKLVDDVWRLQYQGKPSQAADRLRNEIESRKPSDPIGVAYLRNALAGLLNGWEGHKQEAFEVYVDFLNLRSETVDDSPRPQPLWQVYAADVLIHAHVRGPEVLTRIEQDLGSFAALARWNVELRNLLAGLRESGDPAVLKRAETDLTILERRMERLEKLRGLPQASALKAAFNGLGVTADRWPSFGADELWLVAQAPPGNGRSLVVVARAEDILKSVEEDRRKRGKEQTFRLARNGEPSYPMGEGLPGLSAVLLPGDGEAGSGIASPGGKQQLFYALSLALILGLTFFGTRLMWRDTRRESRLAELRSQFVSSVSHELKTPLTGIRMMAETLQTSAAADPVIHAEYLETIVGETERLTRLLNNVLDFSKIERGQKHYHMETASLAEVLENVARAMRFPLAEQGFEFSMEIAAGLPPARIDRDAIEQAVLNLLSNAMKYSGRNRVIRLRLLAEDGFARIQVVDCGIGIPPAERKRIFEKFYRVQTPENRAISGTGLGLALVAHIVDAHGGRVEVESVLGEGSTFTIRLPLDFSADAAAAPGEEAPAPALGATGRRTGEAS